jgi:hypothetical protein
MLLSVASPLFFGCLLHSFPRLGLADGSLKLVASALGLPDGSLELVKQVEVATTIVLVDPAEVAPTLKRVEPVEEAEVAKVLCETMNELLSRKVAFARRCPRWCTIGVYRNKDFAFAARCR